MGVGPWGGGGGTRTVRYRGRDGSEELCHVKKIRISGGKPLQICTVCAQASKWFKGAPTERVFGDKQRVVVKVMVT